MLSSQEEEILAGQVHKYLCHYDKRQNPYYEIDVVGNDWEKMTEHLTFVENNKHDFKLFVFYMFQVYFETLQKIQ